MTLDLKAKDKLPKHGGPNNFAELWRGLRREKAKARQRNQQIKDLKFRNEQLEKRLQEVQDATRRETIRECAGIVGDFSYEDGEVLGIFVKDKILALLTTPEKK